MKRTLRRASLVAKVFGLTLRVMALWAVLGGGGQPAYATHFRYGHISWAPVTGNTIQFTIQNAFRRSLGPPEAFACIDPATLEPIPCSAADGLPGPGDVFAEVIGDTQFLPGDDSVIDSPLGALLYVVTSIDPVNEWLFALALDPESLPAVDTTITHTYPSAGNFTAAIDSCCRITAAPFSGTNAHINNPDGGYRVETVVNVGTGNSSPVTALPPIVLCPINALCSFRVPGADPNGDPLHFRFSTASEASSSEPDSACAPSTFCQPGPPFAPNAASISSTGLYTWNTTGATLGPEGFATLYSTQVTIEDLDAAGNVKSKVAVDFFIQLVQITGGSPPVFNNPSSAPVCGSTTPTPVNVGNTLSFTVQSSDPDPGQTVTLNVAGLPVGATMTPPLPTSGNPVSSTFSWTPTAADAGTYVITFTATDNSGVPAGLQTLCSMTIRVIKNQPPDCRTAAPSVAELWPPNHKFVRIKVRGVTDPNGDPVTITIDSIFQDEPVKKKGTGSGNTCSDATGVGTSTARVRSERAGNPHVPGDGRVYHIRFTGDDGEGGTCTGEVRVCVPHDQRPRHRCVDEGPLFDSTVCP